MYYVLCTPYYVLLTPYCVLQSEDRNVAGLQTFRTALNIELNFLTLFQRPEAVGLNRCIVNKNIFTFRLGKKAIAL